MGESLVERLWGDISDRVGDDLRAVTRYDGFDFETRMREDVRAKYTSDEDQDVVDEMIINQLTLSETGDGLKTGELQAFVRVYDDAWILAWTNNFAGKSGIIVSIQRTETASMADVEWCIQYLDEEIAPLV